MKTFKEFIIENKAGNENRLFYKVHGDSDIKIGSKILKSHTDLDTHFPASKYGNHRFEMIDRKTGKRIDGEESFSHAEIRRDLSRYGSDIK